MGIDGLMTVATKEANRPVETDEMLWLLGRDWAERDSGRRYIFRHLLNKLSGETKPTVGELRTEYSQLMDDCAWGAKTAVFKKNKLDKPWYAGAKRACERILCMLDEKEERK